MTLLAQTTAPASQPAPFLLQSPYLLPAIAAVALMLFFNSRTKKKEQQKVKDLMESLKKGDRIQTIGGIIGTVVEARENEVLVKVDETNNTKIRFSRKAIHRVINEETTDKDKK